MVTIGSKLTTAKIRTLNPRLIQVKGTTTTITVNLKGPTRARTKTITVNLKGPTRARTKTITVNLRGPTRARTKTIEVGETTGLQKVVEGDTVTIISVVFQTRTKTTPPRTLFVNKTIITMGIKQRNRGSLKARQVKIEVVAVVSEGIAVVAQITNEAAHITKGILPLKRAASDSLNIKAYPLILN